MLPASESPFVFEEGETKVQYSVALYVIDEGKGAPTTHTIPIAKIDGKVLVAFPSGLWHRSTSKRILPSQIFSRPTLVEVQAVERGKLDVPLDEQFLKLWIGFLRNDCMESMRAHLGEFESNFYFADAAGAPVLPSAEGLVAVAQEHFVFFSAAEEEVLDEEEAEVNATLDAMISEQGALEEAGLPVEDRLALMEANMAEIRMSLAQLVPQQSVQEKKPARKPAVQAKSKARASAPKPPKVTIDPVAKVISAKASPQELERNGEAHGQGDESYEVGGRENGERARPLVGWRRGGACLRRAQPRTSRRIWIGRKMPCRS